MKFDTSFPIATAMRAGLKHYNLRTFKADAQAGLIVSLLALPLSMALAIAVGLPPQHGIYTAVVAGIVCALLGGSMTQVSGPTAAFVVILAPIVSDFGLHGIIWCQIIAGILLIALGTARMGKLITYVPYPVITGFTAGIGVVIATLALNDFFGLRIEELKGDYIEKVATIFQHLPKLHWQELAIGLASLLAIINFRKITGKIPSALGGIAIGTILAAIFSFFGGDIETIGMRFTYETAEGIKNGIPPYLPSLHLPTFTAGELMSVPSYAEFRTLLGPAVVIAVLAALESLLSATVADGMSGTRHNPNAELNGIGFANLASAFAAGIPATGAIARTASNIHAGAKTPMASIIHAILIMLYVVTLAPAINYIPMSALAALLLVTAWRMSHVHQFIRVIKVAPKSDVAILLGSFFLTVFIDMVAGVTAGMILATLLFMKKIAASTRSYISANRVFFGHRLPEGVMIYHIDGPLSFCSLGHALDHAGAITPDVTNLVIDVEHVPLIDMTGMIAMRDFLASIAVDGRRIILCGNPTVTERIIRNVIGHPMEQSISVTRSLDQALEEIIPS